MSFERFTMGQQIVMEKLFKELEGIDVSGSVMLCGIIAMFLGVIRGNVGLQSAVLNSEKDAVGCLCCIIEALAQQPERMQGDITPWGRLAVPDLTEKSVREIIEQYYAGYIERYYAEDISDKGDGDE